MEYPVIVLFIRTFIGLFSRSLSTINAVDIGTVLVREALKKVLLKSVLIDNLILGHVLQASQEQNSASQVSLKSGISIEVPAISINLVCCSGFRAIALGLPIGATVARILTSLINTRKKGTRKENLVLFELGCQGVAMTI